jgi:xylulokinase
MRLKAAAYGAPVAVLALPDTTCLGAALLGGLAAGVFTSLDDARSRIDVPARVVPPEADRDGGPRRLERQAVYAAAYAALRPLHARLLDG